MDYQLRRGALSGLAGCLADAGVDAAELLQRCRLPADFLQHPEELMPVTVLAGILNQAAEQPELVDLGLQLAARQGLEVLGMLGRLLAAQTSLAEAAAAIQRYMALHNRAEHWRMQQHGDRVHIQRFEHCAAAMDLRHYHELAMANCYRLMRVLGGEDIRPLRLEFTHRPRLPLRVYRQFFGCEVLFDQEQDQLLVPAAVLQRPVQWTAEAEQASARYLQQLMAGCQNDLRQQVATLIQQTLGMQQHSLEQIAALMGLHPRTLQRRLDDEGIIFRQLLNEERSRLACWHLSASDMDITLLSAALGYSDVSAFSRAFRVQHGCPPRLWRQQNRLNTCSE